METQEPKNNSNSYTFMWFSAFLIISLVVITMLFFTFCGCTYNVSMVHTDGTASDVIDTLQEPKTDAKLDIPISLTK